MHSFEQIRTEGKKSLGCELLGNQHVREKVNEIFA
jgi:hypothetical protein